MGKDLFELTTYGGNNNPMMTRIIWILLSVSSACLFWSNVEWRPFSFVNCSFNKYCAKFISSLDSLLTVTWEQKLSYVTL